ncbi:YicC/YloC family endoribonuclease [Sulfuriflexus sp.]|uniref:YicC/YloC family endoribonuclease n=1 Tax=Sulfuriflexus sp. TaxID=2015443 RepID=UPI0028CCBC66|nr:YicC/YloC family endoribonuclease [Sulfuriflexus sp.]MDT8403541.1 YicC/YloC family endoribonuclease [Sulfuriflexus sp.]
MIRSMTAFARCDRNTEWGTLSWEVRSVNHRYLEPGLRMPEEIRAIEAGLRERLATRLGRGKVECNLRFQAGGEGKTSLNINTELAKQVVDASREIDHLLYNSAAINSMDVLRWPGVLDSGSADWAALREQALLLFDEALDELVSTREREGARLREMILERLQGMRQRVSAVREQLPAIITAQRQKIIERLAELDVNLDEGRLEQEAALLVNKMDVDEEMDRLATHIDEVERNLDADKPVGRRLDFLMQEMNREANTLGSKSIAIDTTRASVDLKVLIEQMREQIQNIE